MKTLEPPASLPQCLAILILRTLKSTQEDVAGKLHFAKLTVGEVEHWFSDMKFEQAEALSNDPDLRQKAEAILTKLEDVDTSTAMKIGKLSGDEILMHYRGTEYLDTKAKKVQVDLPEVLKDALDSHLSEIRSLIEKWESTLVTPRIHEIYSGTFCATSNIEADSLFPTLRQHLPLPTLWGRYSKWQKLMQHYIDACHSLGTKIREEGANWQNGGHITDDFELPIIKRISEKAEGGEPIPHAFYKHQFYLLEEGEQTHDHEMLSVDGGSVIKAIHALTYKEAYQALSDKTLNSEAVVKLIALLNSRRDLERKMRDSLREILLKRGYVMYRCKLCPG